LTFRLRSVGADGIVVRWCFAKLAKSSLDDNGILLNGLYRGAPGTPLRCCLDLIRWFHLPMASYNVPGKALHLNFQSYTNEFAGAQHFRGQRADIYKGRAFYS
jgi:hypothetical protein